ncbi:FixH family protein [Malonomonas rubra]|uniref:FixH family protein n=1 Tax=Malonomonas rubra TaxID=57040 RepID=UPI0026EA3631|nr:FixH family protein [Malonomonas rubra]
MPKHFYPALIIFFFGTFVLFLVWSAFQASTEGTQVTDRDYYSKGLKYSSTVVEKRVASVLGWEIAAGYIDGQLQIRLQDGKGHLVSGAKGVLYLNTRPGIELQKLPLKEVDSGYYQTRVPSVLTGEVSIRVEFERDGARINRQLLITI